MEYFDHKIRKICLFWVGDRDAKNGSRAENHPAKNGWQYVTHSFKMDPDKTLGSRRRKLIMQ